MKLVAWWWSSWIIHGQLPFQRWMILDQPQIPVAVNGGVGRWSWCRLHPKPRGFCRVCGSGFGDNARSETSTGWSQEGQRLWQSASIWLCGFIGQVKGRCKKSSESIPALTVESPVSGRAMRLARAQVLAWVEKVLASQSLSRLWSPSTPSMW